MTTGIGGPRPLTTLPQGRDAENDEAALAPWIEKDAEKQGGDPQLVAAVAARRSPVASTPRRPDAGLGRIPRRSIW